MYGPLLKFYSKTNIFQSVKGYWFRSGLGWLLNTRVNKILPGRRTHTTEYYSGFKKEIFTIPALERKSLLFRL